MITGLAVRLVQGLQLNVEPMSVQPRPESKMAPATFLESCRRIMWSVYVMDSWVGSGVDELTMIHEKNIRIRLPSDETDFTLETTKATTAPMFPLDEQSISQSGELDVAAHFVLLLGLRKKVLRYMLLHCPSITYSDIYHHVNTTQTCKTPRRVTAAMVPRLRILARLPIFKPVGRLSPEKSSVRSISYSKAQNIQPARRTDASPSDLPPNHVRSHPYRHA